jgi:hypothetical protein
LISFFLSLSFSLSPYLHFFLFLSLSFFPCLFLSLSLFIFLSFFFSLFLSFSTYLLLRPLCAFFSLPLPFYPRRVPPFVGTSLSLLCVGRHVAALSMGANCAL